MPLRHLLTTTVALASTAFALLPPVGAEELRVHFSMCERDRHTCVVDGDTIWLQGVRLESYDTPEPYTDICGGRAEVARPPHMSV